LDTTLTDEQLVHRIRKSTADDVRAFEALVTKYEARVLTNCRYLSGSVADAPDLAQEVLIKVFFGLSRFEGRSSLRTWLERIKSNHCINYVKKIRPTYLDVDEPEMQAADQLHVDPDAEDRLEAEDEGDRIRQVLDQMTDSLRIPLLLRDMDGFSYDEIAEQLGLGLSAVKMRIKRGREQFRRLYSELDQAPVGVSGRAM
jgi:RNA polymerase sigma-70 factor (ECF subfamily)